jgi:hypothetical protein
MHAVIAECENQRSHPDWPRFRDLDLEADAPMLPIWLVRAFPIANPSDSFQGLWFGMHNPVIKGATTADVYVAASREFDQSSIEWATAVSEAPGKGQLGSHVLNAIYRRAYGVEGGLGNDAEYPLVLTYGAMAARTALETEIPASLRNLRGVAAGFDSGDFLFLGNVQEGRFSANIVAG